MSVPLTQALGTHMAKRNCPACGRPAVSASRLLLLGGLRTTRCGNCGAQLSVSRLSSLALVTLGTWIPIAGAVLGALASARISSGGVLIGGAAGFVLSGVIFVALYFKTAALIAHPRPIPDPGPSPPRPTSVA